MEGYPHREILHHTTGFIQNIGTGGATLAHELNTDAERQAARLKAPLDANFGGRKVQEVADSDDEKCDDAVNMPSVRPKDRFGLDLDGEYRRNTLKNF